MTTAPPTYPRPEQRLVKDLTALPRLGTKDLRPASQDGNYRLSSSLMQFNVLRLPVVNVRTGTLLDGGLMVDILRVQGDKETKVWVWLVDLPEQHETAAHMALQNHVGGWNWELVATHLKAIDRAGLGKHLTGFAEQEIGPLVEAEWNPQAVANVQQGSLL